MCKSSMSTANGTTFAGRKVIIINDQNNKIIVLSKWIVGSKKGIPMTQLPVYIIKGNSNAMQQK